jgi:hypothetical protein
MKLLQELVNPNSVSLTDTAQGVLVAIVSSPTPQVAFETTNGSEKSVASRNTLRSLGLVVVNGNRAALTKAGESVAVNYNLVDQSGKPTERGQAVLASFNGRFNQDSESNQSQEPTAQPAQPAQASEPNSGQDQQ